MKKNLKNCVVWCLTILARLTLKKYKPVVIAVTGSVGKTSAKDAIFAVLREVVPSIRKSDKSFNSEIGVPLTILGCPNAWSSFLGWTNNILHGLSLVLLPHEYPKYIVVEVGADHPGDIKNVAKWLAPKVSVLTKISALPVHVEFFKNREHLFNEKMELAKALAGVKDSVLVTYGDTEEMANLKHPSASVVDGNGKSAGRTIVYGTEFGCKGKCDVVVKNYSANLDTTSGKIHGIKFDIVEDEQADKTYNVKINGVLGITHAYPYLVAIAVLKALNIKPNIEKMNELANEEHARGRMNILSGINGSTLIDDTYNSSPDAVESALTALVTVREEMKKAQNNVDGANTVAHASVTTGVRTIAILGDMMELGNQSVTAHEDIGKLCHKLGIDILATSGVRSEKIAVTARKAGMPESSIFSYTSSKEASDPVNGISKIVKSGDIILIKGSQSARMEKVTLALLDESLKSKAGELLVRQDEEWQKR